MHFSGKFAAFGFIKFSTRMFGQPAPVVLSLICSVLLLVGGAAGQSGRSITVSSEPDASVWIDGVLFGRCDKAGKLTIRSIAGGPHTLKVRASGFKERSMPLGVSTQVAVPLTKTTDEAELAFQEGERLSTVDREKSADAYRRALKLRPTYIDAAFSLARILLDAGDIDDAQAAIAQARRISPAHPQASAIQGRIYKEDGEEAKALAAYKRSITEGHGVQAEAYAGIGIIYKERAETASNRGDFDAEQSNYDEAAKNLKISIKQLSGAPDAMVIYQLLGLIYEKQRKYDEAIGTYQEFLRLFPDSAEASAVQSFIVQLKKDRQQQQQ